MDNNLWEAETWRDMSGNLVGYRVLKRDSKGLGSDFNAGFVVDIYNPKTGGGRLLTTVLVIVGMILISVFTATLTTMMVGDDNTNSNDNLKSYFEKRLNNIEGYLDKLNNQKK